MGTGMRPEAPTGKAKVDPRVWARQAASRAFVQARSKPEVVSPQRCSAGSHLTPSSQCSNPERRGCRRHRAAPPWEQEPWLGSREPVIYSQRMAEPYKGRRDEVQG